MLHNYLAESKVLKPLRVKLFSYHVLTDINCFALLLLALSCHLILVGDQARDLPWFEWGCPEELLLCQLGREMSLRSRDVLPAGIAPSPCTLPGLPQAQADPT